MPVQEDALAVMVRAPVEGTVKTRLIPELGSKDACLLYEAFLKDLFSRLSALTSVDIYVFYTPVDKSGAVSAIMPELFKLNPQKDCDLGGRIEGVFDDLFARGHRRVAVIGSDSPDIPLACVRRTFTALKGACGDEPRRLVLGPAIDGGYYLIAMNASLQGVSAPVFNGIEWGTSSVLHQTLERAEDAGIEVAMLPEWHDVDIFDDLAFIRGSTELPETTAVLKRLKVWPDGDDTPPANS